MPNQKSYHYNVYADNKFIGKYPTLVIAAKSIGISSHTASLIFNEINAPYDNKYKIIKEYH